jgi:uncharacterized protein (DUF433 family)
MNDIISDSGRGPEICGTRITVYDVLAYLDEGFTQEEIASYLGVTAAQTAAAVRYVGEHRDRLRAELRRAQERQSEGNPPAVAEALEQTSQRFQRFRQWLAERGRAENGSPAPRSPDDARARRARLLAEFDAWLAEQGGAGHRKEAV